MRLPWIGIAVLVVAAVAIVLGDLSGATSYATNADMARLAALLALLIVLGGGLAASRNFEWGNALRHALLWGGLLVLLIVLYIYFGETFEQARF